MITNSFPNTTQLPETIFFSSTRIDSDAEGKEIDLIPHPQVCNKIQHLIQGSIKIYKTE